MKSSIAFDVAQRELKEYLSVNRQQKDELKQQETEKSPNNNYYYFDVVTIVSIYAYAFLFGFILARRLIEHFRKQLLILIYRWLYRRRFLAWIVNFRKEKSEERNDEYEFENDQFDADKLADLYAKLCAQIRVESNESVVIDFEKFLHLKRLKSTKKMF